MKKIIFYVLILLIALWIPVRKMDISNLEPIQAVGINKTGEQYVITTDTEAMGVGKTIKQAVESMKRECEKIVYLDTAKYLLVSEECTAAVSELSESLKNNVKVAIWDGLEELKKAAQYMQSHRIGVKIDECFVDTKLPVVPVEN